MQGQRSCRQNRSFEVLKMTRELEKIINSGSNEANILEEAERQGMVTLRQDGILKLWKELSELMRFLERPRRSK